MRSTHHAMAATPTIGSDQKKRNNTIYTVCRTRKQIASNGPNVHPYLVLRGTAHKEWGNDTMNKDTTIGCMASYWVSMLRKEETAILKLKM